MPGLRHGHGALPGKRPRRGVEKRAAMSSRPCPGTIPGPDSNGSIWWGKTFPHQVPPARREWYSQIKPSGGTDLRQGRGNAGTAIGGIAARRGGRSGGGGNANPPRQAALMPPCPQEPATHPRACVPIRICVRTCWSRRVRRLYALIPHFHRLYPIHRPATRDVSSQNVLSA